MRKLWLLIATISVSLIGTMLFLSRDRHPIAAPSDSVLPPRQNLQYNSYSLASSLIHVIRIPAQNRFSITTAISPSLNTVEEFAKNNGAIAVLNGGFFDPQNQKSTSIVVQQGLLVGNPRLNERLMNNPQLTPYLNKILNRTEFRGYVCGSNLRYDIALHQDPKLANCRLVDVLGGGSRLLPLEKDITLPLIQEGFLDIVNGKVIRDSLGSNQPNARSAVGITDDGSIVLVMVAQKPEYPNKSGMSLTGLATFMKSLGVKKAMNLDGGSSSSLYFRGKTFYGKVKTRGNLVKRPVKSVLIVQ
ncbi:MAG TPA: phosphodiester glycosidase family protein [Oculatellaceae cyanobacterium]